jgi:hypothetical protein
VVAFGFEVPEADIRKLHHILHPKSCGKGS